MSIVHKSRVFNKHYGFGTVIGYNKDVFLVEFDEPNSILGDGTKCDLFWGDYGKESHCGYFKATSLIEVRDNDHEDMMKEAIARLNDPPKAASSEKKQRGRPKGSVASLDNQYRSNCPICDIDKEDFRCACGKSSCYACIASYNWHCPHCDKDLTKLRDQLDPKSKKRIKKFEERVLK